MTLDAFQLALNPAVDAWVDILRGMLVECALGQGMSPADAEDCAQESILRLLTHSPDLLFQGPANKFQAWLRSIARHDVLDYARHLARERYDAVSLSATAAGDDWPPELEIPDTCLMPEEALAKTLFWELLTPAIDALEDEEHFWFVRYHLLRQDAKSIAKAEATTEKRVYRVLEKARRHVERWLLQHGTTPEELIALLPAAPPVPLSCLADDEGL